MENSIFKLPYNNNNNLFKFDQKILKIDMVTYFWFTNYPKINLKYFDIVGAYIVHNGHILTLFLVTLKSNF